MWQCVIHWPGLLASKSQATCWPGWVVGGALANGQVRTASDAVRQAGKYKQAVRAANDECVTEGAA